MCIFRKIRPPFLRGDDMFRGAGGMTREGKGN
jgi:hypothetical protein